MSSSVRSLAAVVVPALAVVLLAAWSMSLTADKKPGGQFDWVNRTGGPLFHDGARVQDRAGQGIPVDGCSTTPFEVTDKEGGVVARLGRWCDGQRWVVRGTGDTDLGPASGG